MQNTPPESFLGQLRWLAERQVYDRLDLYKLQGAEKMAKLAGLMVMGIATGLVGFMALFFISFMAGYFFAAYTGSLYTGFAIVAAFYLLVFVWLMLVGRKKLSAKISDIVIREIFDDDDDDDDDDDRENGKHKDQ